MRYHSLATDYDGTIAAHAQVSESTLEALQRLQPTGRKLILVTGRELPDLMGVFPELPMFDRVVAENGALLYRPKTHEQRPLSEPPPPAFVDLLRQRGVTPLSVGRVIVATTEPNETLVLNAIRDLGLELQVIFNKGAVMILPSGVNKATGLGEALKELRLSRHHVVGIGDAENDHAFLEYCECAAAVANALPALKAHADVVTGLPNGDGVRELIHELIANDLHAIEPRLTRHHLLLGTAQDGREVRIKPYGTNLLVCGSCGSGKTTLVSGFLERLVEQQYQACIIDPDGDYVDLKIAVIFGDSRRSPGLESLILALDQPQENVIVNLAAIKPEGRLAFFQRLLPAVMRLRAETGRPDWIVVDEAQQVVPVSWQAPSELQSADRTSMLFVTVHPNELAPQVVQAIGFVIAVGQTPGDTLREFAAAAGRSCPDVPLSVGTGEALAWQVSENAAFAFRPIEPRSVAKRHVEKP